MGNLKKKKKRFDRETEERWRKNTDRNESSASLSRANKLCRDSEEGKVKKSTADLVFVTTNISYKEQLMCVFNHTSRDG